MGRDNLKQDAGDELQQLCLQLFDSWCERRSVVPLAYLLHGWPILDAEARGRTRLHGALRHLQTCHAETLSADDHQLIGRVLAHHMEDRGGLGQGQQDGKAMCVVQAPHTELNDGI